MVSSFASTTVAAAYGVIYGDLKRLESGDSGFSSNCISLVAS